MAEQLGGGGGAFSDLETRTLCQAVIAVGRHWERIRNHPDYIEVLGHRTGNNLDWKFRSIERADQIRISTAAAIAINPQGLLNQPGMHIPPAITDLVAPKRDYNYWTEDEVNAFYDGLEKYGHSRSPYRDIMRDPDLAVRLQGRDAIGLKKKAQTIRLAAARIARRQLAEMQAAEEAAAAAAEAAANVEGGEDVVEEEEDGAAGVAAEEVAQEVLIEEEAEEAPSEEEAEGAAAVVSQSAEEVIGGHSSTLVGPDGDF